MKIIQKILVFIGLFIILINSSFSIYVSPKNEKIYNNFYIKIEKKFDKNKQIVLLSGLEKKLISFKNQKKYKNNKKIQDLLDQFLYLNKNKIFKLKKDLILSKLKKGEKTRPSTNYSLNNSQNYYQKEFEKEKLRRKKIIDSYPYSRYFKNKSYTKNHIFLENGVWYAYKFKNFNYFDNGKSITLADLKYNNIDLGKDLLFVRGNNTLGFVKNPKKIRLISDFIIKDLPNKYYFLEELKDDFRLKDGMNYDKDFLKLKQKTKDITYNLSKESKYRNIYNYILKNTKYSSNLDFNNYKIFSGIETFLNHDGVCEGYAKLMVYMLMFAGIDDTKVIRGYVIDAPDFPQIGHAWVKAEGKYYDPTFDDPVGAKSDKNFKEYKYFGLPRDLFYANRFDRLTIPEYIKSLSIEKRKEIIQKKLWDLYPKYKDKNYEVLKLVKFKKQHNIGYNEKITLSNLNKILPLKVVYNFTFVDNGKKRQIRSFKYYDITNANIENLLEQLDYNLDGFYFFKWYNESGNSSYRLAYNVEF